MQFDRIAFYCQSKEAEANIKKSLALSQAEWVKDTISEISEIKGERRPTQNLATLEVQSNNDLGITIELIKYIDGRYWHESEMQAVPAELPVFSHSSLLLGSVEPWPHMAKHWQLLQESITQTHTNATYRQHYRVYGLGRNYFKFIKRRTYEQ